MPILERWKLSLVGEVTFRGLALKAFQNRRHRSGKDQGGKVQNATAQGASSGHQGVEGRLPGGGVRVTRKVPPKAF